MAQETLSQYEAARGSFRLEVPEYFNFAEQVVGRWAQGAEKRAVLAAGRWTQEAGYPEGGSGVAGGAARASLVGDLHGTAQARSDRRSRHGAAHGARHSLPGRG